jgi:polyhydroxybutyrate depolymerase
MRPRGPTVTLGATYNRGMSASVSYDSLPVGTLRRTYRLFRPRRLTEPRRLALVLHGAVGSAREMADLTGFDEEADRLGWVAAYPEAHNPGVNGGWDTYACCEQPGVDDVTFIAALIDRLGQTDGIDTTRVCVTGFSRGGMMVYRLGCELSRQVSAIAPVAGNMADRHGSVDVGRRPERTLGVLVLHGLDDRNVPVEGGPSALYPEHVAYAPLSDVLRRWRDWNECSDRKETVERDGPVTVRRWRGASGAPVELRLLSGGGHAWPGPRHPPTSAEAAFNASRVIADFFAAT